MNILDFLRVLRANRLVLLACLALGAAAGLLYSLLQPTLYTSTSTGFVTVQGEASISGTETAQTRAQSYIPLINSRTVRDQIAQTEGLDTRGGHLQAAVVEGSNLIEVSATSPSAHGAADLANAALVATADVANNLDPTSDVQVTAMEDALAPTAPSSPDHPRNVLYGLAIGGLIGLLIAFLRRFLDVNVRTTTDAQAGAGAGLLGAIPQDKTMKAERTARLEAPSPRAAEAIRQLRTNLRFAAVDDPPRTVAFTSSNPGEGKSAVIGNLALTIAAAGTPVILIDADLRRPRQASQFGVDGRVGLSEVLNGDVELQDVLHPVGEDGLLLLPSGRRPPNPSEQLGSERMRQLLAALAETHMVLVDAPPVLPVTDSTLLASAVDGTVLVVRHGKTRKEHLQVARDMLAGVNARVLGVVLNGTPASGVGSDYYGGGYAAQGDAYDAYYQAPHQAGLLAGSGRRAARAAAQEQGKGLPDAGSHSGAGSHAREDAPQPDTAR